MRSSPARGSCASATAASDRPGGAPRHGRQGCPADGSRHALRRGDDRAPLAGRLGRGRHLRRPPRREPPEILRARDVSLSVRAHPYRPRAQLHDGRRDRALQAGHRPQRAAPDGVGRVRNAGRERRDGKRRPSGRLDLCQHRRDARPDEAARLFHRLVARIRYLRSGILWPAAGALPRFPRQGPRLPQGGGGELGSGRHDRTRQRAGDRRLRLALRRAGGTPRAHPMVLPHLGPRRRASGGAGRAHRLAREGPHDAGELDRPLPRPALCLRSRGARARDRKRRGLHHPPRHPEGRELRGHLARPSAREGAGGREPRRGPLRAGLPPQRHVRRRDGDRREAGARHRPDRARTR